MKKPRCPLVEQLSERKPREIIVSFPHLARNLLTNLTVSHVNQKSTPTNSLQVIRTLQVLEGPLHLLSECPPPPPRPISDSNLD